MFLVSSDCCVALPCRAIRLSVVFIVVFNDHTHLLFFNTCVQIIHINHVFYAKYVAEESLVSLNKFCAKLF